MKKIIAALTIFFFSVSNLTYAAPFTAKTSALRSASFAVSDAGKSLIDSLSFSKDLIIRAGDSVPLKSILDEILRENGIEEGADIAVDWRQGSDIEEADTINMPRFVEGAAAEGPTRRLQIPADFIKDYAEISRKDVVLAVDFGDGMIRDISVAKGLAYRALGGAFDNLGVRYRIINSAIWIWYHFIYKNKYEDIKQDNRKVAGLLDLFFEYINNHEMYKMSGNSNIDNIINFREQIPFLLADSRFYTERQKILKLQQQVKRLILIINALYFGISETIPEPVGINLFDVPEEIIKGERSFPQTIWSSSAITEELKGGKSGINILGYTYIKDSAGRVRIYDKVNNLIIDKQDASRGLVFSDDGRYVACIGHRTVKVFDFKHTVMAGTTIVPAPDMPVITYRFSKECRVEFLSKYGDGQYRYILLYTGRLAAGKTTIAVHSLYTGKALIKERARELTYTAFADGRYLQIMEYGRNKPAETLRTYRLPDSTAFKKRLSPIIDKRICKDAGGFAEYRFDATAINAVTYGEGDSKLAFSPKTARILPPKAVWKASEYYDKAGPDIGLDILQNQGIDARAVKHYGWTALAVGSGLQKLIVYNLAKEAVITYDKHSIKDFWFSPDGRYILVWDNEWALKLRSLEHPEKDPVNLGTFLYISEVGFTADSRHIIVSGEKKAYGGPISRKNMLNIENPDNVYKVVDFEGDRRLFFFASHLVPGTERIICQTTAGEDIIIDRNTGIVEDISLPGEAEEEILEPEEVRSFGTTGEGTQKRYKYRLEIYEDHLLVEDWTTKTPIIDIAHSGEVNYRIIDNEIIEITDGDTRAIYDLRSPERPLAERTQIRGEIVEERYIFDPELVNNVVCLYSQDEDSGEEELVINAKVGDITSIAGPDAAKTDIVLTDEEIKVIAKNFEHAQFTTQHVENGYVFKLADVSNLIVDTLHIYGSPDKRYIICVSEKEGSTRIYNPEDLTKPILKGKRIEFSSDGRHITDTDSTAEGVVIARDIYSLTTKEPWLEHLVMLEGEMGSFTFPGIIKRIACEYENGNRLWFDHRNARVMFTTGAERTIDKAALVDLKLFARALGYNDAEALFMHADRTDRVGPYFTAWTDEEMVVAKIFPESEADKQLKPIVSIEGKVISYKFIGPNSEWLITIEENGELGVYNLEADRSQKPVYRTMLRHPYRYKAPYYIFSQDKYLLALVTSGGAIEVVDISNPGTPLRRWEAADLGLPRYLTLTRLEGNYLYAKGFVRSSSVFRRVGEGTYRLNIRTGLVSDASIPEVLSEINAVLTSLISGGKLSVPERLKKIRVAAGLMGDTKIAEELGNQKSSSSGNVTEGLLKALRGLTAGGSTVHNGVTYQLTGDDHLLVFPPKESLGQPLSYPGNMDYSVAGDGSFVVFNLTTNSPVTGPRAPLLQEDIIKCFLEWLRVQKRQQSEAGQKSSSSDHVTEGLLKAFLTLTPGGKTVHNGVTYQLTAEDHLLVFPPQDSFGQKHSYPGNMDYSLSPNGRFVIYNVTAGSASMVEKLAQEHIIKLFLESRSAEKKRARKSKDVTKSSSAGRVDEGLLVALPGLVSGSVKDEQIRAAIYRFKNCDMDMLTQVRNRVIIDHTTWEHRYDESKIEGAFMTALGALANTDREVHNEAVRLIVELASAKKELINILIEALKQNNPIVTLGVVRALGIIPEAKYTYPALLAILRSPSYSDIHDFLSFYNTEGAVISWPSAAEVRVPEEAIAGNAGDINADIRSAAMAGLMHMHLFTDEVMRALVGASLVEPVGRRDARRNFGNQFEVFRKRFPALVQGHKNPFNMVNRNVERIQQEAAVLFSGLGDKVIPFLEEAVTKADKTYHLKTIVMILRRIPARNSIALLRKIPDNPKAGVFSAEAIEHIKHVIIADMTPEEPIAPYWQSVVVRGNLEKAKKLRAKRREDALRIWIGVLENRPYYSNYRLIQIASMALRELGPKKAETAVPALEAFLRSITSERTPWTKEALEWQIIPNIRNTIKALLEIIPKRVQTRTAEFLESPAVLGMISPARDNAKEIIETAVKAGVPGFAAGISLRGTLEERSKADELIEFASGLSKSAVVPAGEVFEGQDAVEAVERGASLIVTPGVSLSPSYIDEIHSRGAKVVLGVGSLEEAKEAKLFGADAIMVFPFNPEEEYPKTLKAYLPKRLHRLFDRYIRIVKDKKRRPATFSNILNYLQGTTHLLTVTAFSMPLSGEELVEQIKAANLGLPIFIGGEVSVDMLREGLPSKLGVSAALFIKTPHMAEKVAAMVKASSSGKKEEVGTPGAIKRPDDLGVTGAWEKKFEELMLKAQEISKGLVDKTELTLLRDFLNEKALVDRSNQIVITLPDTYAFNPGLKEFAESVREMTINDGSAPLFRIIISIDSSLPDAKDLQELAGQVSAQGIIAAKRKMIEALNVANVEIRDIEEGLSHNDKPVETAAFIIDKVLNLGENRKISATQRPRVIMFQNPVLDVEPVSEIEDQLERLASRKNVVFVLPRAETKDQAFNVFTLLNSFFRAADNILSNSFLQGVLQTVKLPKIESEETADKTQELHQVLLQAIGCA